VLVAAHLIPAAPARPVPIARPRHLSPRTRARTHESARSFPTLPPSLVPPVASPSFLPVTPGPRLPSHSDSNYPVPDQRYPTAAKSPSASRLPRSRALLATALVATVRRTLVVVPLLCSPSSILHHEEGGRCRCLPVCFGDSGAWARICVCLPPDPPEARGA
jgi:hypothetical protein